MITINTGASSWKPPPEGFFKVNIDGASKGNPGVAGFGGAIRDHQGQTKYIFHGHLEKGTNNMAELLELDQCLEILVEENLQNANIEAESEFIIRVAKKIHNGTSPDKVSKHWKLLQVFFRIHSHLQTLRMIRFIHVRRKANMLGDRLANEGVTNKDKDSQHAWE